MGERNADLEGYLLGGALGTVAGAVAAAALVVLGGWDYSPAIGMGVAAAAGIALFLILIGGTVSAAAPVHARTASPAQAPAPASAPASAAAAAAAAPVAAPEPEPEPAAAPAPAAAAEPAAEIPASQPQGLPAPRDGKGDNLQEIEGIGPALEKLCHDLGIWHFDQIAGWGPAEIAWMDGNLKGFRGRVTRDKWVAQARLIGQVGVEAFRERAKSNDY